VISNANSNKSRPDANERQSLAERWRALAGSTETNGKAGPGIADRGSWDEPGPQPDAATPSPDVEARRFPPQAGSSTWMARSKWKRGRTAPTLWDDVRRFSQSNNADKVFGTHSWADLAKGAHS